MIVAAAADFTYFAYRSSDCFVDNPDPLTQESTPRAAVPSGDCQVEIARRDTHMRRDALAVLLAVAVLIGASVTLSDAHRRTKRIALGIEAVVLVLVLAYSLLLVYGWH